MILLALFFFSKIILAIQSLFCFHINFRIILIPWKIGIWIGTALNLQVTLSSTVILTILILLIHEHSSIFFFIVWFHDSTCLQLSSYASITSLLLFIGNSLPLLSSWVLIFLKFLFLSHYFYSTLSLEFYDLLYFQMPFIYSWF